MNRVAIGSRPSAANQLAGPASMNALPKIDDSGRPIDAFDFPSVPSPWPALARAMPVPTMTPSIHTLCSISAFFAIATTAAPAQTIVSGSGYDLSTAIQAAAPGDVLIVRAGWYWEASINRGITVICDPGVELFAVAPATSSLDISNIPAGEAVVWSGGKLTSSFSAPGLLRIAQSSGLIHLDDLELLYVDIDAADNVTMTELQMNRRNTRAFSDLVIRDSNVALLNCTIETGRATSIGAVAITATRSNLTLQDTRITTAFDLANNFDHDVIALDRGTLSIQGARSFLISRGPMGAAIRTLAGTVILDPSATVRGSVVGPPPTARILPFVDVRSRPVGTLSTARAVASPGAFVVTLIGLPRPRLALPIGDLWLASPITLDVAVIPLGQQYVIFDYRLPAATYGIPLAFQGVSLNATSGRVDLGSPTIAVGL